MADALEINPDELTLDDLEEFQDITGQTFDEAFQANGNGTAKVSAKAMKAIVYLIKRQKNPAFTLEDAGKVRLSELQFATTTDPTEAAGSNS